MPDMGMMVVPTVQFARVWLIFSMFTINPLVLLSVFFIIADERKGL